jgi:hypothetical protein
LVFILIASHALLGCGSGASSSTPAGPAISPLTGNWNLFGSRTLLQYPFLSLTLIVNGNEIIAQGDQSVQCPNLSGSGGTVGLTGQIAADGTFELSDVGRNSSFLFSIMGTVPPSGSSTWAGTYTLTTAPASAGCTINQTAPFTATAFAPLDGTYTGTLIEGSSASPTGSATVSLNVSQGSAIVAQSPAPSYLPLTATIAVTGFSCFTHGTSSTISGASVVKGDVSDIMFNMDDSSQVILSGHLDGTDSSQLNQTNLAILSGQCSGTGAFGTLTRQ